MNASARQTRRAMAGVVCAALALVAEVRPARAEGAAPDRPAPAPITLVDSTTAPFSSAELGQALLARLTGSEDARPPQVRITGAAGGMVTVEVGARSRRVELGDRTGTTAARVVALVVAELMSDGEGDAAETSEEVDAAPSAPAVTVAEASDATPAASLATASASEPSGPIQPLRLSVTGGVAKGIGSEELLAGAVDADLTLALGDSGWRLTPSAGLVYMPTRNGGTWNEVSYTGAAARLLGGGSWRLFDLAAGPFATRYSIGGATSHAGTLFGAEGLLRLAAPLSRHMRLVVATRAHVYANRVRVVWADGNGYATPRLELTIGIGLAWDWAS
jgi:hypothetical protein